MPELRGKLNREYFELIQAVADFTGVTPFGFILTAGLEKARELIVEKIEFDQRIAEMKAQQEGKSLFILEDEPKTK